MDLIDQGQIAYEGYALFRGEFAREYYRQGIRGAPSRSWHLAPGLEGEFVQHA